jgi:glucose 1-dehydrogenase
MSGELSGRVAIVTGGASGIGAASAALLEGQGARVVVADLQDAKDGTGRFVAHDVASEESWKSLLADVLGNEGRLDIMVNNAGVETRTSMLDTTEAQYDTVLGINLKSAFFGTQLAARQMIKQGTGGRIVNISSVHEDRPMPGNAAYCLSKGGMRMLTRTAGVELAPHDILVVGVAPGAVATPINQVTMNDPSLMRRLDAAIPLGRMAKPEEIARIVAFLAGDGASYMTATTVLADGGMMQQSPGL